MSTSTSSHQLIVTKATATIDDGNVPGNVLDNNLNTRWSGQGKGQKLMLDLDKEYAVDGVDIMYYSAASRTSTCDILVGTTKVAANITSETAKPVTRITFNPTNGKQVTIVGNGNSVNDWNSIIDVKVFGNEISGGSGSGGGGTQPPVVEPPQPIPPEPPTTGGLDHFGSKMIYPTKSGGRVFNAPFDTGSTRTLKSGQRDGNSDLKPLGSATYTITPSTGEMKISGSAPRVYVYDEARQKSFENVEVTCYYKRVSGNLASYQGFEIGIRGEHELGGSSNARVYYYRHSINGIYGRMKEEQHPSPLQEKTVKNGVAFNTNTWYGMKFITRTMGNGSVKLESYMDTTDGKAGGTWVKMEEFIDSASSPWGGWPCYTPKTARCGCHSVFSRTDNATDFRIKKFTIREVGPLP